MDRATVYGDDPAAQAGCSPRPAPAICMWSISMAPSPGSAQNREAVEAIVAAFPGKVQLGGGIRTPADVEGWLEAGVERIVIGTAALKDPQFVKDMARAHAPARSSWRSMRATAWLRPMAGPKFPTCRSSTWRARFEDAGVASLLFTDIGRDGLLKGVNIDATVGLARQVDIPVIASGGVKGLIDIDTLMQFAARRDRGRHHGPRAL